MSIETWSISYDTSRTIFIWENLCVKDCFSFKAEIQPITTKINGKQGPNRGEKEEWGMEGENC